MSKNAIVEVRDVITSKIDELTEFRNRFDAMFSVKVISAEFNEEPEEEIKPNKRQAMRDILFSCGGTMSVTDLVSKLTKVLRSEKVAKRLMCSYISQVPKDFIIKGQRGHRSIKLNPAVFS